jgi:hypothetical protein
MIEPWFSPDAGRWFSFLSMLALLSLLEPLAGKGRHRSLVISVCGAGIALGGMFLAAAAIAASVGQPAHVVRPLALGGFLVAFLFVGAFAHVRGIHTDAEFRRTVARDM